MSNTPTITFTNKHHIIAALFIGLIASWGFVFLAAAAEEVRLQDNAKIAQEWFKR